MTEPTLNEPFSLFNASAILIDGDNRRSLDHSMLTTMRPTGGSWACNMSPSHGRNGDVTLTAMRFLFLLWGAATVLTVDDPAGEATSE